MNVTGYFDEESALLTEFNHRLFNTLQVISNRVTECANVRGPVLVRRHLEGLQQSLCALAALHRLLAFPAGGDLEDYCEALCDQLIRAFGRGGVMPMVRIDASGIGRREERYIALLIVELVTNVLKHSLCEGQDGVVWIELCEQGGCFRLTVGDSNCAPAVTTEPSRMVLALAGAIGGVARVCDRGGYTVIVELPKPPAQELFVPVARPGRRQVTTER
jgi:two-component sensor histidine kinase